MTSKKTTVPAANAKCGFCGHQLSAHGTSGRGDGRCLIGWQDKTGGCKCPKFTTTKGKR